MQEDSVAMRAALQILDALDERRDPQPADIAKLESLAGPKPYGVSLEEFVCGAFERYFQQRVSARMAESHVNAHSQTA